MDYVLFDTGLSSIAVYINYLLYVFLALRLIYFFIFKPNSFLTNGGMLFFRKSSIWLSIFVAYAFFQIILNPDLSSFSYFRQNYSVVIPSFSLAILMGLAAFKSRRGGDALFRALYWVMAIVIVYSEISSLAIGAGQLDDYGFRAEGIFNQANNYGYFLTLFGIISLFDLTGLIKVNKRKSLIIFGLVICLILILRTGSYGSMILITGVGVFLNYQFLKRISLIKFIGTIVILIIVVVTVVSSSKLIGSARIDALWFLLSGGSNEKVLKESTFDFRSALIRKGFERSLQSPFVGKGIEARNVPIEEKMVTVHNVFIVELLKGGLIGLGIVIMLYFELWKSIGRIQNKFRLKMASILFSYIIFIDNTLTYASFLSMNSGVIALALITGLILVDAYESKRSRIVVQRKSLLRSF
ncbi:MAG: hypothetical protein CMI29_06345 [Opitutae bacterium]|nr:hypothetical protein [Opitutae bacterium]|tara:strand:+ start:38662 stop:39897 length:1236 start_codon:yes stop_codon:yes gene_type:complete